MKILFVCTGNTCRSPMAEAIFNNSDDAKLKDYTAVSRGTNVMIPQPINPKSEAALNRIDISGKQHYSRQLESRDIKESDLILTMTSNQKMMLKSAFPGYKAKIFTLNEKAYGKDSDIADPFGMDQETYNHCCEEILEAVNTLICMI